MQWQEFRTHIRHVSAGDLKRIERAFTLGMQVHANQKRKSGDPYFIHPIAVALMLSELGADTDTLIAALLHDAVEDTPMTIADIDKEFDGAVSKLIDGVTKLSSEDVGGSPNLNEQMESLRKIFTLMQNDIRIMVIKLVDRLHNMQTIEFLHPERQRTLAEETLEIYVKIADRLSMRDVRDELEALCLSVLEPEIFKQLADLRSTSEERGHVIIDNISRSIREHRPQLSAHTHIYYEHKSWDRLRSQLGVGSTAVTGLSSITVAIVCDDVEQAYQMLGLLHQLWRNEALSVHDFINAPHMNGYRGLHTTIIAPDGTRIRCKIRTREMQAYARHGVTTSCFKGISDIASILPWTKQISPLTTDTAESSNDFWQSLQSDILGETIIIHGPDDSTVQVPKGATVLDGAFYLFKERALHASSTFMNGVEVSFNTELQAAASVDIAIDNNPLFQHAWLRFVKTHIASGAIRAALTQLPEKEKVEQGRSLLQSEFNKHRKGFLEEFNLDILVVNLGALGRTYASVNKIFSAIAEGKMDSSYVYQLLFPSKERPSLVRRRARTVAYSINLSNLPLMERVNHVQSRFAVPLDEIRYILPQGTSEGVARIHVLLTENELASLLQGLSAAGVGHLRIETPMRWYGFLILLLLLLWGLDPIVARILLFNTTLSPFSLTVVRFSTFFIASAVTYSLHRMRSSVRSTSLWPLHPSLILAGIAFFTTGIFSYLALQIYSAAVYILFIIAGIIAGRLFDETRQHIPSLKMFLVSALLGCSLIIMLTLEHLSLPGILAACGGGISFTAYSRLSKRYQEVDAHIQARYPAFVFWLSCISLILDIGLLPFAFANLILLPATTVIAASTFALVFCFLPYVLFFECMQRLDSTVLDRLLPIACIVTFLAQALLYQSPLILVTVPFLTLLLWMYIPKPSPLYPLESLP